MEEIMLYSHGANEKSRLLQNFPAIGNNPPTSEKSSLFSIYKKSIGEKEYLEKQREVSKTIKASLFSADDLDRAIDNLIRFVCSKVATTDPIERIHQCAHILSQVFEELAGPQLESSKRTQLAHHFDARTKAFLFQMTLDNPQFIGIVHELPAIDSLLNQYSVTSPPPSVAGILGSQFSPEEIKNYKSHPSNLSEYTSKREKNIHQRLERKIQELIEEAKKKPLSREDIKAAFKETERKYIDETKLDHLVQALDQVHQHFKVYTPSIEDTQKELALATEEYRKSYAELQRLSNDIPWAFSWKDIYLQMTRSPVAKAMKFSELYSARPESTSPPSLPHLPMKSSNFEKNPPRRTDFEKIKNLAPPEYKNLELKRKLEAELNTLASQRFEGKRGEVHSQLCELLKPYTQSSLYRDTPLNEPIAVKDAKECATQLNARMNQLTNERFKNDFMGAELNHLTIVTEIMKKWIELQTEFEDLLTSKQSELSKVQSELENIRKNLDELGNNQSTMSPLYFETFYEELGLTNGRPALLYVGPDHPQYGRDVLPMVKPTPLESDKIYAYNEQRKSTFQKEQAYKCAWEKHYQRTIGWELDIQKSIGILPNHGAQTLAKGLLHTITDTTKVKTDVQNIPTEMQKNIQTIFEETLKASWSRIEQQKPIHVKWRHALADRLFSLVSKVNREAKKQLTAEDLALLDVAKKYSSQLNLSKEQREILSQDDGSWSAAITDAYTALLTKCHSRVLGDT